MEEYTSALHKEIDHRNTQLGKQDIKTIYFGGWTPLLLGKERLFWLLDHIIELRGCDNLEECNIELNPDPFDETLDFIDSFWKRYPFFHRVRFSFGLQTFDDEILKISWRQYNYNQIKHYLRNIQSIKQANMCYNFDFISFGSLSFEDTVKQWWTGRNSKKIQFFQDFVFSQTADSFSLYMLELFPGSKRHNNSQLWNSQLSIQSHWELRIENSKLNQCINPDDDKVLFEYNLLSDIIQSAWYKRYEVSNYALPGKQSIHNMVYWTMQPYIGIWASASGFIKKVTKLLSSEVSKLKPSDLETSQPSNLVTYRYTNTTNISDYLKWNYIDSKKTQIIDTYGLLFEEFMLGIRSLGIQDMAKFESILVENWKEKVELFQEEWLCIFDGEKLKLTHEWYNIGNRFIGELIK